MTDVHQPSFPFSRQDTYHPSPDVAKLRHGDPVTKVKLFDGSEAWYVGKHKDICQALSSSKLSADRRAPGFPEIHEGGKKAKDDHPTFVNLDDPDHKKQRMMLESFFEPEAVQKMRPMMQEVVDRVLDKMIEKYKNEGSESIDLIEEFATPVPTQIIYKVIGVPDKDVEELSKDSSVRTGTSRTAAEQANQSLEQYMEDLVDKRNEKPTDDMISKLVVEQMQPGHISKETVVKLAFLVLTAGNAALINSIGLGVLTLFEHPKQLEEFKKNLSLAPQVVNELQRYNTASALNSRRAVKEDTEIHGQKIKKGEGVICGVQSGDRDEDLTANPEEFDIHREYDPKEVLGFGYGPHRCQGEALSRTELEIAFGTLFKKLPNLRLRAKAGDLPYSPPEQNTGVMKLPVSF